MQILHDFGHIVHSEGGTQVRLIQSIYCVLEHWEVDPGRVGLSSVQSIASVVGVVATAFCQ